MSIRLWYWGKISLRNLGRKGTSQNFFLCLSIALSIPIVSPQALVTRLTSALAYNQPEHDRAALLVTLAWLRG